jgi:dipeptidyl aminopeptidase/acylaminoacyl peptidase
MWGIVKDPEQYRCAISIAGVAKLREQVNDFGGRTSKRIWRRMTPDFDAVSPVNFVEKIQAPLLLIHGRKDVTVEHEQSEIMDRAMRKAKKKVDFVSLKNADHYFTREPDRLELLQSIERFLAEHNPAD